jgi:hypothetical protein
MIDTDKIIKERQKQYDDYVREQKNINVRRLIEVGFTIKGIKGMFEEYEDFMYELNKNYIFSLQDFKPCSYWGYVCMAVANNPVELTDDWLRDRLREEGWVF